MQKAVPILINWQIKCKREPPTPDPQTGNHIVMTERRLKTGPGPHLPRRKRHFSVLRIIRKEELERKIKIQHTF